MLIQYEKEKRLKNHKTDIASTYDTLSHHGSVVRTSSVAGGLSRSMPDLWSTCDL